ncbi:MAG: outer membrane protein assembly factor BamD [Candidatus Omnitrophica bacterium]|jgi:outer membrane protein assembly factor BamD (BamD/ComL family)|nr:outer membrane protein assembly factor BamD [Candidatus Omnitrophota bacterium]MDD5137859.1 outer membrane protein assembly factor BamD [Candidatus Omnitrophota bacterium]MDD5538225.1 outer membrane protein assembly factor BamD [Candidatus Omnitrophota bacterium]
MKMKVLLLWCCAALFVAGCATVSETGDRYRAAVQAFRDGQTYFAFMHLKAIVKDDPTSPYAPAATFALGEYYFDNEDTFNAVKTLSDYVSLYPKDKGVVFAKLIIYKIITEIKKDERLSEEQSALIKEIRKELFSQPLFLIFYDRKIPRSYKSIFNHSYLVYDYVDKIKVFRDDKSFLELSP